MKLGKAAIISSALATLIFMLDLWFRIDSVCVFYICFILYALWADDERFVLGSAGISILLILIAWLYNGSPLDSSSVVRLMAGIVIVISGILSVQRKDVEFKLRTLNETLELRVLARTAAAEEKSKMLEQQIRILQGIKNESTENSFRMLDEVISNLKDISKFEGR